MAEHANEIPPGQASQGADKRRDLRIEMIVQKVDTQRPKPIFFGYAANISKSGMFIHTENPKEPGSQFEVELNLPRPLAQKVRCHCQVVWRRLHSPLSRHKPGMGLRFLDMPREVASAIDAWASHDGNPD